MWDTSHELRQPSWSKGLVRGVIASAATGLVLFLLILGAIWLRGQTVDHNLRAETVAVNYTQAVLMHDYSTWWDNVSPTCRAALDTMSKAQWMAEAKRLDAQTTRLAAAPADILVAPVNATGSGATRTVEVRVENRWTNLSDYLDVTVRQMDGQWGVTDQAAHGLPPSFHCDVWTG